MYPIALGLAVRPMPAMNRSSVVAPRPSLAFGSAGPASVAIGQIKSSWEYGVLMEASVIRAVATDLDKGLSALGQMPDGLVDAFGNASNAIDAIQTFSARQRGFMLLSQRPQSQLTLADGKVGVRLLNTGDTHPDTLAYALTTPKGNYALTIAKTVNTDNVDGVYAKFRNHVIADDSQVQNVPRFHAAHPEQGWILTELIEANNLPKDWRARGTQTLSRFLTDNNLVHVSPTAKNHIGPYMVDLGHIVPRERYDSQFASTLGPANVHLQAVRTMEASLV